MRPRSCLESEVAIKVLPSLFSQDPGRLSRFKQEAQATASLNHPNILSVHQFGIFQGAPYLVSELLVGESLGGPKSIGDPEIGCRNALPFEGFISCSIEIASWPL